MWGHPTPPAGISPCTPFLWYSQMGEGVASSQHLPGRVCCTPMPRHYGGKEGWRQRPLPGDLRLYPPLYPVCKGGHIAPRWGEFCTLPAIQSVGCYAVYVHHLPRVVWFIERGQFIGTFPD